MLGVWPSQMRSQKLNLGLLHGWWRLNCLSHHLLPSRVCISRTVECWVESGHWDVGYGSPGVISAATANTSLGFLWPEWAVQNASANGWLADKKPIAQPLVQHQIFSSGKQRKTFRFRFLPLQQAGMFLWERWAAGEMSVVVGGKREAYQRVPPPGKVLGSCSSVFVLRKKMLASYDNPVMLRLLRGKWHLNWILDLNRIKCFFWL